MKKLYCILFCTLFFLANNLFAGVEEDLQKLKDLFDSGALTKSQYESAKRKITGEKDEFFMFFGVPLGGEMNEQAQTIGGKKFKFLNHGQADNLYGWRSDRSWKQKSGSKYIWEGRKGKDWEGTYMVVIEDPNKKDRIKSYSLRFAYFEGVPKVFSIIVDDNYEIENKVVCKKLSTEHYMKLYDSGLFEVSNKDHSVNLTDPVKIIENDDIYVDFVCGGEGAYLEGDFSAFAKDKKLDELSIINK